MCSLHLATLRGEESNFFKMKDVFRETYPTPVPLLTVQRSDKSDAVNIADATTQPLPVNRREPLLMVIDGNDERRVWVVRLLTFAEYQVHDATTPLEAFMWWVQHPSVPQALLLGYIAPVNLFFVQRLVQQVMLFSHKNVPVISLLAYLPDAAFLSLRRMPIDARGTLALLESLWHSVPRYK